MSVCVKERAAIDLDNSMCYIRKQSIAHSTNKDKYVARSFRIVELFTRAP